MWEIIGGKCRVESWLFLVGAFLVFSIGGWIINLHDEKRKAEALLSRSRIDFANAKHELRMHDELDKKTQDFQTLYNDRVHFFPIVGEAWSELENVKGELSAKELRYKKHPAYTAAEKVREVSAEKRELYKELVEWKYRAKYYEELYPWLEEDVAAEIAVDIETRIIDELQQNETDDDPVRFYMTPEQYKSLSPTERNQRALDRYWSGRRKSKWLVGKMYERYVGYLYEKSGWSVQYFGIEKRFDDLGRDLIAKRGKEIHIIQCKNWSQYKQIYENSIFQLFGTYFTYANDHPNHKVVPVFCTTTKLSDTASEFARRLDITVRENHKLDPEYPTIKCNVSRDGQKIYHLPFDQQYDRVIIEPHKGEFFAKTCLEAEAAGFRRAFKHKAGKL